MATVSPSNRIERAHMLYRDGRYEEALGFYTEAIGMAKTKPQKIALHSNRAACYLKLHDFKKVATCVLFLCEILDKIAVFISFLWFFPTNAISVLNLVSVIFPSSEIC